MAKNAIEIERGRFYWLKDKFKEEDGKKKPMSINFPEEEDKEEDEEDLDLDYGDHRKTTMD